MQGAIQMQHASSLHLASMCICSTVACQLPLDPCCSHMCGLADSSIIELRAANSMMLPTNKGRTNKGKLGCHDNKGKGRCLQDGMNAISMR